MRKIDDVLAALPSPAVPRLPAPSYSGPREDARERVGLAVESMRRHLSDEGWQLFDGLGHAGYILHGHAIGPSLTDVREILARESPDVVVGQDRREWMGLTAGRSRDQKMQFRHVEALRERPDVFKLTVIKDAHCDGELHRQSATEMGCHGWITPYNLRVTAHLAPYLRPEHLIRTYHTLDAATVPPYSPEGRKGWGREGCLLSGAISAAYPLRSLLVQRRSELPMTTYLPHPGYRADGCRTPEFLRSLSEFEVAICTSSRYGYALRKLIEATAAGCVVITDLPSDEILPEIDGNLVRVRADSTTREVGQLIMKLCDEYDSERQQDFAAKALAYYDHRAVGGRLALQIEALRRRYRT